MDVWAIYIRVSTSQQVDQGYSLEVQLEKAIEKLTTMGVTKWIIYREEGESGEDIDRPEMNKLRQDIDLGLIKGVICSHPDRISRNLMDKLIFCADLEKQDVQLVFVDTEYQNSPEGQLFFNMTSAIAQYELHRIRERTTSGRLKSVKRGNVMPMRIAPYGYDFIDCQLVINEREAEVVRLIYKFYCDDHLTYRQIGEKLYNMGVWPKRGESPYWGASSIHRIIESEIYIGKYVYNKRKTKKIKGERTKNGNRKKTYTIRDESEWIVVNVPPIVTEEMFELANKQKVKNTTLGRGDNKFEYLLKSLLKCSECGRTWNCTNYHGHRKKDGTMKIYPTYRCPNVAPKKYGVEKCPSKTIASARLDNIVWDFIVNIVYNPDVLMDNLADKEGKTKVKIIDQLNLHHKLVEGKKKERERIKIMFVKGVMDEDEMVTEIKKVNNEMEIHQTKINELKRRLFEQANVYKNMAQIEKKLNVLKKRLSKKDDIPFEEKREFIASLVDYITIKYNTLDKLELTYYGDIESFCISDNVVLEVDMTQSYEK